MKRSFEVFCVLAGCTSCTAQSPPPSAPLLPSAQAHAVAIQRCATTPGERSGARLAPREICVTVMGAYPELRNCYDRQPTPERLPGFVRIYWQIAPSGAVSSASIGHDSFESDFVASCLKETVERLYFPQAGKETGASWTFSFAPPPS